MNIPLSKHRIEALADGVFAIVATLIVLELRVPELPRSATTAVLLNALQPLAFPMFSFLITFMLAGSFWALHQLMMHFVKHVDGAFLWLNIAFLMFVSLLPFSTGMLGRFHLTSRVPLAIYFGNQCAIGGLLWLQWQWARRRKLLESEAETSLRARDLPSRAGALSLGAGLAVIMAFVAPQFSFYSFIVPTLISRALAKRRSRLAGE